MGTQDQGETNLNLGKKEEYEQRLQDAKAILASIPFDKRDEVEGLISRASSLMNDLQNFNPPAIDAVLDSIEDLELKDLEANLQTYDDIVAEPSEEQDLDDVTKRGRLRQGLNRIASNNKHPEIREKAQKQVDKLDKSFPPEEFKNSDVKPDNMAKKTNDTPKTELDKKLETNPLKAQFNKVIEELKQSFSNKKDKDEVQKSAPSISKKDDSMNR